MNTTQVFVCFYSLYFVYLGLMVCASSDLGGCLTCAALPHNHALLCVRDSLLLQCHGLIKLVLYSHVQRLRAGYTTASDKWVRYADST
jgi:hypothetical protein